MLRLPLILLCDLAVETFKVVGLGDRDLDLSLGICLLLQIFSEAEHHIAPDGLIFASVFRYLTFGGFFLLCLQMLQCWTHSQCNPQEPLGIRDAVMSETTVSSAPIA